MRREVRKPFWEAPPARGDSDAVAMFVLVAIAFVCGWVLGPLVVEAIIAVAG